MFDKHISLFSTDRTVSLDITAGTEGEKIILGAAGGTIELTKQQFIDIAAPAFLAYAQSQKK